MFLLFFFIYLPFYALTADNESDLDTAQFYGNPLYLYLKEGSYNLT